VFKQALPALTYDSAGNACLNTLRALLRREFQY
jgi:hypothetical protein